MMKHDNTQRSAWSRSSGKALLVLLMVFAVMSPKKAHAFCIPYICELFPNTLQESFLKDYFQTNLDVAEQLINLNTDINFQAHQVWMKEIYFKRYWGLALMKMAEQFSAIAMQQMQIVGSFLDAKNLLETQRLYRQLIAQANKDYYPSEGLCQIGTLTRNLAGADRTGQLTAMTLARHALDRQVMNINSSGSEGAGSDMATRRAQVLKVYCDKNDMNGRMGASSICTATDMDRKNKDVDFARTLGNAMTLDVRFSSGAGGGTGSADTQDLIALENNLYGHHVFQEPVAAATLGEDDSKLDHYLDLRAIAAKRSVAENSFQTLAGMKSAGSPDGTAQYMAEAFKALGVTSDAEALKIVGPNPSYYAAMEVLSKKILQNPQFYTDLYDKPANVERKRVALQALSLIQERDNYKVGLRSELLWSQLLELKLMDAQNKIQDKIGGLK